MSDENLPDPFPPNQWRTDGMQGHDNAKYLELVRALQELMR